MIDRHTGSLALAGGEVKPHLELSCFLESELGKRAKKRLEHGEWLNYGVRVDDSLDANFVFKGGVLVETCLCKRTQDQATWATWTEVEEASRKATHDALLKQELGSPPYRFSWGIVESVFDQKGGGSQVIIRYV